MGLCFIQLQDTDKAMRIFTMILNRDPYHQETIIAKCILENQQRFKNTELIKDCFVENLNNPHLLILIGEMFYNVGDYK